MRLCFVTRYNLLGQLVTEKNYCVQNVDESQMIQLSISNRSVVLPV